ncbi:uncharacterized protein TNCV_2245271 [Trichonephila clavipes]|nr:uncharacterized protein TNCV_2245271 [Trichonephila clavipes]
MAFIVFEEGFHQPIKRTKHRKKANRPVVAPSSVRYVKPAFVNKGLRKRTVEGTETRSTRELLATDHVIFNHGQVTWTTPELAPPSPNYHTTQREDVSALDRFNVHRCPTRRVFSGTGLEPVTKQATVRYLYHSATAAPTLC